MEKIEKKLKNNSEQPKTTKKETFFFVKKDHENQQQKQQQNQTNQEKKQTQQNSNQSQTFIKKQFTLLHIMGPHAGEGEDEIFKRKLEDVQKCGKTFWITKCFQKKGHLVEQVVNNCKKNNQEPYIIFLAPSQKGGAKDTKTQDEAKQYSQDKKNWQNLPKGLSPLTGLINENTQSLIFDELELVYNKNQYINIWDYSDISIENNIYPVKFNQSKTAVACQLNSTSNHKDKMKNNIRKIVAIARLCKKEPIVYINK